jgi:hypothetical protein
MAKSVHEGPELRYREKPDFDVGFFKVMPGLI